MNIHRMAGLLKASPASTPSSNPIHPKVVPDHKTAAPDALAACIARAKADTSPMPRTTAAAAQQIQNMLVDGQAETNDLKKRVDDEVHLLKEHVSRLEKGQQRLVEEKQELRREVTELKACFDDVSAENAELKAILAEALKRLAALESSSGNK
jgi:chromosome segregation ATPase